MLLGGSERLSGLSGVTQHIRHMIPTLAHLYSGPRVTLNDCQGFQGLSPLGWVRHLSLALADEESRALHTHTSVLGFLQSWWREVERKDSSWS